MGLFLPPTTTTRRNDDDDDDDGGVRNARGGGGGGLADAQRRGEKTKPAAKKANARTPSHFTRVEQPLKSLVFDHEKKGKRGKKKDIKPHFL